MEGKIFKMKVGKIGCWDCDGFSLSWCRSSCWLLEPCNGTLSKERRSGKLGK